VLDFDSKLSQLGVKVFTSSLRLLLRPFLKAGTITADVENAESPSNPSDQNTYPYPKTSHYFDHTWLLCTLTSHPI